MLILIKNIMKKLRNDYIVIVNIELIKVLCYYFVIRYNQKEWCVFMYFDPGTGSLFIQIIVAFVASIGAFFVFFKNKIKNIFVKGKKENKKNEKQRIIFFS